MGVKVFRQGPGPIREGNYTQFTLIYHPELDQPTESCEGRWRAFEETFFEQACKPAGRTQNDVFRARAHSIVVPGTTIRDWEVGARFTVVMINDNELKWLVDFGSNEVRVLIVNTPHPTSPAYSYHSTY
ncbi:hypothetical protein CONLIGDRAFT_645380 [Coniochaeta ligniaria NRRL 30616]|uniref:Uncharacterized protein n=1 Tax=Coniochaeta ligniaria NRRL 30616 TaxID=1408157 RepID=A0A1J7JJ12_9PEZI|nr:hypothetical protein CONLIGDRAFT_645380 [Coniochaeta ligniaria NRRL 30616]